MRRVWAALGFGLGLLAAVLWLVPGAAGPEPDDPARAFQTAGHSAAYAGIDRWAYSGMRVETMTGLLAKDGYACPPPPPPAPGEARPHGIVELVCAKTLDWPLTRTLSVHASVDYDTHGRLVAAEATSELAGAGPSARGRLAAFLRARGWIEPERLKISGAAFGTVDLLARLAVDAIGSDGWRARCTGERLPSSFCAPAARARRASGLPALPQGAAPVIGAMAIGPALERVGLLPPVSRGADNMPSDSLLVRVDDARMWLDFTGRDLTGRTATVSVALDADGGVPVMLEATLAGQTRMIALAGAPRRDNDEANLLLIPRAGDQRPAFADWLPLPHEGRPGTFTGLARAVPRAAPGFLAPVAATIIAAVARAGPAEEELDLYPALTVIEHRAGVLRAAGAANWLPAGRDGQFIAQAFPADPAIRAAWALARCESDLAHPQIDRACWQRLVGADPPVAALLRAEASTLAIVYGALEPAHPLRVRLRRLNDAFAPAPLQTDGAVYDAR